MRMMPGAGPGGELDIAVAGGTALAGPGNSEPRASRDNPYVPTVPEHEAGVCLGFASTRFEPPVVGLSGRIEG